MPLGLLAEEAARLVDCRLRARGVRLEIQPDLPVLFGERARLLQLLLNLLDNAAKFMGSQATVHRRRSAPGPVMACPPTL